MIDASAASATATVTGSGVFPTALARGAAGAPASAAGTAAAAAAIPLDAARGTAAARGGVSPTVPIDWTTARNDHPPETATTQRRQYQVTPTVARSQAWRTGMSGAFALLKADGKMVRYLAIGPEAEDGHKLLAALACDLETPETYAQAHARPHGRVWGTAERMEFAGLTTTGMFKPVEEE